MQNPFQHINDVLNYSGKEAYRMLGSQVNTEHLMLGILHCKQQAGERYLRAFRHQHRRTPLHALRFAGTGDGQNHLLRKCPETEGRTSLEFTTRRPAK